MSTPPPPIIPLPDDDPSRVPTREVDGEEEIDEDANQDQVDSADADRLATELDDDDEDIDGA